MKPKQLREKKLQVNVTDDELNQITQEADNLGLKVAQFVRLAISEAMTKGIELGKREAPKGQSLATASN